MTSKEINTGITLLDNIEISGIDMPIPYMGFFWREVDFDKFIIYGYQFGADHNNNIAFMQSNKWDYDYVSATPAQCIDIKAAIINILVHPTKETVAILYSLLESLKL